MPVIAAITPDLHHSPGHDPIPGTRASLYDATLDALIRDIKSRQSLVKSVLEDEDAEPLWFIDSAEMSQGAPALASQITRATQFSLREFREQTSTENAFGYLRAKIESIGIFVLLLGNLGSHHTNIPADTFRGFAIADPIAPFVVVNDQDARPAWSFTVLHEAAHLWLGTTGVSGASMEAQIERFCNDVAGEILLPSADLGDLQRIRSVSFEQVLTRYRNLPKDEG